MTAAQDQLIDWLPGILRTALARRLGVPAADLDALVHLERAGPLTQRDLAERLLLSSGAVTFLVDRLEQAGLVGRVVVADFLSAVTGHAAGLQQRKARRA